MSNRRRRQGRPSSDSCLSFFGHFGYESLSSYIGSTCFLLPFAPYFLLLFALCFLHLVSAPFEMKGEGGVRICISSLGGVVASLPSWNSQPPSACVRLRSAWFDPTRSFNSLYVYATNAKYSAKSPREKEGVRLRVGMFRR